MKPSATTSRYMAARTVRTFLVLVGCYLFASCPSSGDEDKSLEPARIRARLIHDLVDGTLHAIHEDFFNPNDKDRIPSASLEKVFEKFEQKWGIKLGWLGVNTKTMRSKHRPKDDFQEAAKKALAAGNEQFAKVEGSVLRYAGAIQLHAKCLQCHEGGGYNSDRSGAAVAGLLIDMPVNLKPLVADVGMGPGM